MQMAEGLSQMSEKEVSSPAKLSLGQNRAPEDASKVFFSIAAKVQSDNLSLPGAGSSADSAGRLAKEFLLKQRQSNISESSTENLLPRLSINTEPKLKQPALPVAKSDRAVKYDFNIGNNTYSYDNHTLAVNNTKLLAALMLEGGKASAAGCAGLGMGLLLHDAQQMDKAPGINSAIKVGADLAMIQSGFMRFTNTGSGSLVSGLGYLGLGSRLAVSDADRFLQGDHSMKNSLALGADTGILAAGVLKLSAYGPKWLQAGITTSALAGRIIVSLLPDGVKTKSN